MTQAKYCCQKCNHEWEQKPGPTQCPKCGHLYVTWLNHPLTIKRMFKGFRLIDKVLKNE